MDNMVPKPCHQCGGGGWGSVWSGNPLDSQTWITKHAPCHHCHGSGTIWITKEEATLERFRGNT